MPAKTAKKTTKSNVAKSSNLKSKKRFDWRIIAVIVVILAAGLGYLYVRMSRASGYVWTATPGSIGIYDGAGTYGTKNGKPVIYSVYRNVGYASLQKLQVTINSNAEPSSYCIEGYAIANTTVSVRSTQNGTQILNNAYPLFLYSNVSLGSSAGNYNKCFWIEPAPYSPRNIEFWLDGNSSINNANAPSFTLERISRFGGVRPQETPAAK